MTVTEQNAPKWAMFTEAYDRIRKNPNLQAQDMWLKMSEWIGLVR